MKILFRRDLNLIWWINVGISVSYTIHGSLLPLLLKERGLGEGSIGFALGMVSIGMVLGYLTTGRAIDRLDRRWFMLAGGLIWALSSLMAWFAYSVLWVALLRLSQGFGFSILYTAALVYAAQALPPDWRGRVVGMVEAIGALGIAVTPVIAYALAERFGFASALWLAGITALLVGLSALLLPPQPASKGTPDAARSERLIQPAALVPGLIGFCLFFCATAFISLAPLVALRLGVTQVGLFLGLRALGTVPTRLASGYIADRTGPVWAIGAGYAISALALGLVVLLRGEVFSLGLALLFGLGMGLASPALVSWMLAHTPLNEQAVALNTFYVFTEGSGFFGAWAFGWGLEKAGLASLFGLSAMILLGLAGFVAVSRGNHSRPVAGMELSQKGIDE
jgi:MFS family permease